MSTAYVVVTLITVAANLGTVVADLARFGPVLANGALLGVPQSWLPMLAALKAAGAAGLLVGLLGLRPLGVAAATGRVLFFVGAVAAHIRAHAYRTIAFPAGFLALAVASLSLAIAH